MQLKLGFVFALLVALPLAARAQVCSHPRDVSFYAESGYTVRSIEFRNPFSFLFFVRSRLDRIKEQFCTGDPSLCIKENAGFAAQGYRAAFETVRSSIYADRSFGSSPATLVAVTSSIENCQETGTAPKTIDIVYRILSTDPVPAIHATPEERRTAVENPATATAEKNSGGKFKFQPVSGYDHTRRGYGGGDIEIALKGAVADSFRVSATGSSSGRALDARLGGARSPKRSALDRAEYNVGYRFLETPAAGLRLARGDLHARFTGTTKPRETPSTLVSLRYGASVEQGNQQSSLSSSAPPSDILANSAYGAVRFYTGLAATTRYSESAVSYGLQIGGPGLAHLNFQKHVGDFSYGLRFPGARHNPWDIQARLLAGGITGSSPILINERFFGGNTTVEFISGDSWRIANGPLVRSIANRRLNGAGFGGTAFYSANFTIGKVIAHSPMIPKDIEESDGFDSSIEAAENTARTFFADDYTYGSPEFSEITLKFSKLLTTQLDALQKIFKDLRAAESLSAPLDAALKKLARDARGAQQIAANAAIRNASGRLDGIKLKQLVNPNPSANRLRALLDELPKLAALVPPAAGPQIDNSRKDLERTMTDLTEAFKTTESGPQREAALRRATADMTRPHEIIDTLRHEANRVAFSLVGLFDAGRIWPDPNGTRYAIGGGGRFSIVNINLTLGYAVNPNPIRLLGQGRGAIFFAPTYTNLFR